MLQVISHWNAGCRSERTQEPSKYGRVILNNLHTLWRALNFFLSFTHCRAAPSVIPLHCRQFHTIYAQPNIGLPPTRPPQYLSSYTVLIHSLFRDIKQIRTYTAVRIINILDNLSLLLVGITILFVMCCVVRRHMQMTA